MAGFDVINDVTPLNRVKPPGYPVISALRSAIAGSGVAASYPTARLQEATENDLIAICRTHSITVGGTIP